MNNLPMSQMPDPGIMTLVCEAMVKSPTLKMRPTLRELIKLREAGVPVEKMPTPQPIIYSNITII